MSKKSQEYNREITKLLLEFLLLSVTLSGCMFILDANRKQVRQAVLGAMSEQAVWYESKEEECLDKYLKGCDNPATNYCVALRKECKDIVEFE